MSDEMVSMIEETPSQADPGASATPPDATGGEEPAQAEEGAESAPAEEAPEPTDEQGAEPSGETRPISKAEQRIRQLITERDEWRARAIQSGFEPPEKELGEAAQAGDIPTAFPGEPQPEQFKTQGEYLRAWNRWDRDCARAEEQQRVRLNTFTERVTQAAEKDPEVPKVVHEVITAAMKSKARGAQAIVETLVDSENYAALAKYLYINPREHARIAALPPLRAATELGRLEAKLAAAPSTKKITTAPAPITPVGSGGGVVRDIGDPKLSSEERIAALRKARSQT